MYPYSLEYLKSLNTKAFDGREQSETRSDETFSDNREPLKSIAHTNFLPGTSEELERNQYYTATLSVFKRLRKLEADFRDEFPVTSLVESRFNDSNFETKISRPAYRVSTLVVKIIL